MITNDEASIITLKFVLGGIDAVPLGDFITLIEFLQSMGDDTCTLEANR